MVPLPDDDELREHTEALIATPPDIVIATTGIGFRGWIAAADGWGLADELTAALGKARVVSRGPKATGALRAAGLPEEWSPESESSREVLHYLRRGRHRRPAHRGAAARRHRRVGSRSPSSSTNCAPRGPRWCRSGCTAGVPHRATATFDALVAGIAEQQVRRRQLHVGARRGVGADARRRDGHRGPSAVRTPDRSARDVRRAGGALVRSSPWCGAVCGLSWGFVLGY